MRIKYAAIALLLLAGLAFLVIRNPKSRENVQVGSTEFLGERNYWNHLPPEHLTSEELTVLLTPWAREESEEFGVQRRELAFRVAVSTAEAIILEEDCSPRPLVYHALPDTSVWFQNISSEPRTLLLSSGERVRIDAGQRARVSLAEKGMGGIWYACQDMQNPVGLIWVFL